MAAGSRATNDGKSLLRERLRFRRNHFHAALSPFERATVFRAPPPGLRALLAAAQAVGGYAANGSEAPADGLLAAAGSVGAATALPCFSARDAAMAFARWMPGEPLASGPWRVQQPTLPWTPLVPDLLLVPLLGFDRSGGRLGQGGGHYDRYCAQHPDVLRIGIGWAIQELDKVPTEPHDMPLDAIVTEQEWIVTGDRV